MKNTKTYRTAMYVRLSKKDEDKKDESDSVVNQKLLIEGFIKGKDDLELCGVYIDDGFTGTNFDRPKMKEMLADIDSGKIDCVVVKDLSRFGRERVETGIYIARTFKDKGVRFIAINDNYDTLTADGTQTHIIMPIKALTNDSFSRDISIKVRSSQRVKRSNGDLVSSFAPYGYRKDEKNKNHLVPDDYAGEIVKDIFSKKMNGYSAAAIAEELNESGILSPAEYKKASGQKYATGFGTGKKAKWSAQAVIRILKNEVYVGNLAQGKRQRISYKVRKNLPVLENEWIRCEGTHEAIVSRRIFDTVQDLMKRDTIRGGDGRESYLYAGVLFCADCGKSMVRRNDPRNKDKGAVYICSSYNMHKGCSRHTVSEEKLNVAVLEFLQKYIDRLRDASRMAKKLGCMQVGYENAKKHDAEIVALKKEMDKYGTLKGSLYKDYCDGIISEGEYERYKREYEEMEKEIDAAIREQERIIDEIYERGLLSGMKLEHLKERLNVGGLDRGVLVTLVDRVLVSEGGYVEVVAKFGDVVAKVDALTESVLSA